MAIHPWTFFLPTRMPAPVPGAGSCQWQQRPVTLSGSLPAGYEIHRMDRALLAKIPRHDEKMIRYGGINNFTVRDWPPVSMRGDEFVCEAYADMEVMGARELGVTTQIEHRGLGLATIACAHLIRLCEESGTQKTYWDCASSLEICGRSPQAWFWKRRGYKRLAWFPANR